MSVAFSIVKDKSTITANPSSLDFANTRSTELTFMVTKKGSEPVDVQFSLSEKGSIRFVMDGVTVPRFTLRNVPIDKLTTYKVELCCTKSGASPRNVRITLIAYKRNTNFRDTTIATVGINTDSDTPTCA